MIPHRHILYILSMFLMSMSDASWAVVSGEVYSESALLETRNIWANTGRFKLIMDTKNRSLRPFMMVGMESFRSLDREEEENYSHNYLGAGLQYQILRDARVFISMRHKDYVEETAVPKTDARLARAMLVYGRPWKKSMGWKRVASFGEVYSENLFDSEDDHQNLIHASYIRQGISYQASKIQSVDLYVEPFWTMDSKHYFYNNKFELRPSMRLTQRIWGLSLMASFSRMRVVHMERGEKPRGFSPQKFENRVLFILGGNL